MSRSALRVLIPVLIGLAPLSSHAAEGGLVLTPDWTGLLPILLVFFVVLILPVNRLLFAPLLRVLDQREERIAGTRARAERLELDAQELLERYEVAVRDTRAEAEQQRRSLLETVRGEAQGETGAARAEAEQRIEAARREVTAAMETARGGLRGQAEELARQAASQVLGRAL